jgi:hypothetical protein
VNVEPGFGATEVADGVAAVVGGLDPLVIVTDVGGGGVDPDAQQASGRHVRCGPGQVIMGLATAAVLEHLDPEDDLEPGRGPQGAEVAGDQLGRVGPRWCSWVMACAEMSRPIRSSPASLIGMRLRPLPQPTYRPRLRFVVLAVVQAFQQRSSPASNGVASVGCGGRSRNLGWHRLRGIRLRRIRLRPMWRGQVEPGQQPGNPEGPDSTNLADVERLQVSQLRSPECPCSGG